MFFRLFVSVWLVLPTKLQMNIQSLKVLKQEQPVKFG